MKRLVLLLTISLTAMASAARADEIVVSSGGNPLPVPNIKILRVAGTKLFYRSNTSGNEGSRELDQIQKIKVDDEPNLTAAEEAYLAKQWPAAMDGYQKALRSSEKAWVKDRSASRLIDVGDKVGRLDIVMSAYVYMVSKDAKAAAGTRPKVNDTMPGLDAAVLELNKGLQDSKLNDERRVALLSMLLDVQRARKDTTGQTETLEQLQKYSSDMGNDPTMARTLADLTLSIAKSALQQKNYDKVLAEIDARKSSFVDPNQQIEALMLIAQAKDAQLGTEPDPKKLKDVGLDYMRVVANARDIPNAPQVPAALFATGRIMEKLNEPKEAVRLYSDVAKTENAFSAQAKEAVDRLNSVK